ncbi:MAG: UDP-N-acetylmuramoyl-L-alanine--D-glutamate ligase [Ignavibacteria bacterium]|nr:UDP-N-acetylmuramoyl-L-alanine--D-glutamate ligase [Ignavibacteria bacterium]
MDVRSLQSAKVSIIGAARSGVGIATLLKTHGANVFVSDLQTRDKLVRWLEELEALGIEFETGGHTERVFNCSLMVISPGVPSTAEVVLNALRRNVRVVSELEVASWFCRSPIVAITGSNGKTTTTTLVGRMLADARIGHVVAGNIGTAFSTVVRELKPADTAVLEVSSFQLDHIESFRPSISVILNITEDHMDRYDYSMEKYSASKGRIFMNQRNEDVLIYDADDPWTSRIVPRANCRTIPFSARERLNEGAFVERDQLITVLDGKRSAIINTEEISIKGLHNLYNSMAATVVGQLLGVSAASLRSTLRNFKGVEHRLEFVREVDGVRYINDSKATNVDSVWYALQAFKEPIVLLLGGRDKGNDYTRLASVVADRVKTIIAIGESAAKVESFFGPSVQTIIAASMEDAVVEAKRQAKTGEIVLLSPACASFDWFENYEHRGRVFKEIVGRL